MSVIDRDLKHINSIEMIFAGSCNLKCSYCIIHKNPKVMHEYNEKVRKSVLDGKF
jgi:sulfatase maturation enzyme AslB (radical SAM superfamily)